MLSNILTIKSDDPPCALAWCDVSPGHFASYRYWCINRARKKNIIYWQEQDLGCAAIDCETATVFTTPKPPTLCLYAWHSADPVSMQCWYCDTLRKPGWIQTSTVSCFISWVPAVCTGAWQQSTPHVWITSSPAQEQKYVNQPGQTDKRDSDKEYTY